VPRCPQPCCAGPVTQGRGGGAAAGAEPGSSAKMPLRNERGGDGRRQLEPAPGLTPPACCCRCRAGAALRVRGAWVWVWSARCYGCPMPSPPGGRSFSSSAASSSVLLSLPCPPVLLPGSCGRCLRVTTESTSEAGTAPAAMERWGLSRPLRLSAGGGRGREKCHAHGMSCACTATGPRWCWCFARALLMLCSLLGSPPRWSPPAPALEAASVPPPAPCQAVGRALVTGGESSDGGPGTGRSGC